MLEALKNMGIEVVTGQNVERIEEGGHGLAARRIIFENGDQLHGDALLAFCGLMPKLDFMASAGLDVQRGLLVSPELATSNEHIWAAGDVCQIFSPEENRYRVSYDWKSVVNMGRIAACNMSGGHEVVNTFLEGDLLVDSEGHLDSPYWHYQ